MNTTHKWNSYNDYSYQFYNERSIYKYSSDDEIQEIIDIADEYETNFLNLPENIKVCG